MVRVAINGFGRIGRVTYRAAMNRDDIEIVAVNDLADAKTLAYLLKYDSVHGVLKEDVRAEEGVIRVGSREFRVLSERDPENLPWKELEVDVVIESTGLFRDRDKASKHLRAGAQKVIISAPSKDADLTVVVGVNHEEYDHSRHHVISTASCTTNCLAPLVKVLHDEFGVERGFMTTVHAYTNDQRILDMIHRDLRRARAAAVNIIPTSTGAASALHQVIPDMKGRMDGIALRVPVADASIVDLVAVLGKDVTAEEVNEALKKASESYLRGILEFTMDPIVSSDVIGNPASSIVDGLSTNAMGNIVKVLSWYDNEWGYSNRMLDMIEIMYGLR
ncbi:MAG: hypothetical protein PWR13_858 [Archaeoglobi archaeon]|nr:type I glyceraldehyde-3-phosphate dehydrogenase [Candidatus Mnemosynella bozhongmuii]MDI3502542.1 hypothetical protein [Archaeoglobi archaeon]MDK2781830.1 hypothetical protein [Archaeoglobi archaeon]